MHASCYRTAVRCSWPWAPCSVYVGAVLHGGSDAQIDLTETLGNTCISLGRGALVRGAPPGPASPAARTHHEQPGSIHMALEHDSYFRLLRACCFSLPPRYCKLCKDFLPARVDVMTSPSDMHTPNGHASTSDCQHKRIDGDGYVGAAVPRPAWNRPEQSCWYTTRCC